MTDEGDRSPLRRAVRAQPDEVPLALTQAEETEASVRDPWVAPSLCEKREQLRFRCEVREASAELKELLARAVAGRVPEENLQLVTETMIGERGLLAYARSRLPDASPEQLNREYHRLYRQRASTIAALAGIIGPDAEDGGLLGPDSRDLLCSDPT